MASVSTIGQSPKQRSLYTQIKFARFWLPTSIVGVVLVHQFLVVPWGGEVWRFWAHLLFYSILGPAVTYITLDWIAGEVLRREQAQDELRRLFDELQASHALLSTLQKVTEQFASATDLETVLSAASRGISEATHAQGTAILMNSDGLEVSHSFGLSAALARDAAERNGRLEHKETLEETFEESGRRYYVLSLPLLWGGRAQGSIHAYYLRPPGSEGREGFSILSSEFSAAAEANKSRTRDLLTLFEVDRSIRAEGNLEHLLATLLTQTMLRAEASMGGVYLADEEGLLQLKAHHGLSCLPSSLPLRLGEGFVGRAAAQAEPCLVQNLNDDERQQGGSVLTCAGSAIALPLMGSEGLLGVVILAHERPEGFDEAHLPFLNLLAGQVSLAVRNARAYLQSEELAIAEERARIAREIHDGVAQSLAFSALKLDLVSRLLTQPDKAQAELEAVKKTIRESIKEVRRSIFALRPIDLERHGFVETIRRYCSDYGQQNDIRVELQLESPPQLTVKSEAVLFRIFQEAMHNVAKHAGAKNVTVTVGEIEGEQVFIRVEDDGQGFDPQMVSDRVTSAGGLGLRQMSERVEARGGRFEIHSVMKGGTCVYASLPL